ncbi:uncharacterized protein BDV14DRAFT_202264 [Aspergillus stella-maris]|uniref:uncharacterized protein n=1 Tax=Aspergillus stella-maris TaxID=1810926 RepID=UPI003CCE42A1
MSGNKTSGQRVEESGCEGAGHGWTATPTVSEDQMMTTPTLTTVPFGEDFSQLMLVQKYVSEPHSSDTSWHENAIPSSSQVTNAQHHPGNHRRNTISTQPSFESSVNLTGQTHQVHDDLATATQYIQLLEDRIREFRADRTKIERQYRDLERELSDLKKDYAREESNRRQAERRAELAKLESKIEARRRAAALRLREVDDEVGGRSQLSNLLLAQRNEAIQLFQQRLKEIKEAESCICNQTQRGFKIYEVEMMLGQLSVRFQNTTDNLGLGE